MRRVRASAVGAVLALVASAGSSGCSYSLSAYRPGLLADRAPSQPVVAGAGGTDAGSDPPAPLSRAPRDIAVPEDVRLANGVRVLLVERHGLPLVSTSFLLRFDATESATVAPQLYAAMMKGGSAEFSSRSMSSFLSMAGVIPHASANVDTIVLTATMLAPHAKDVIDRLGATMSSPAFESGDLDRAQRGLLEKRTWLRKYPNAYAAVQRMLLGDAHPARVRAFDDALVRAASRDDLVKFERAYLSAENLTVAVVGDFRRAEIVRVLEARLGHLRRAAAPPVVSREPPPPEKPRLAIVPWRDGTQSKIALAFSGPPPRSKDRAALFLLAELLSASSGRLMQRIREEEGASYGVGASLDWWRTGGAFYITTSVESRHTVTTVDAIVREVARLATERIPDDELARAKGRVIARARSSGASPYAKDLHELEAIASEDLPLDHFLRVAAQLDAVDAADVREAAATYLRTDRIQIAVAGNPAAVETKLRKLGIADVSIAPPP